MQWQNKINKLILMTDALFCYQEVSTSLKTNLVYATRSLLTDFIAKTKQTSKQIDSKLK